MRQDEVIKLQKSLARLQEKVEGYRECIDRYKDLSSLYGSFFGGAEGVN